MQADLLLHLHSGLVFVRVLNELGLELLAMVLLLPPPPLLLLQTLHGCAWNLYDLCADKNPGHNIRIRIKYQAAEVINLPCSNARHCCL